MVFAFTSKTPLKIPGKPRELFIWFSKSERPVATILAPASFASHGHISGIGFAHANTMESVAILVIHSFLITPGPDLDAAMQMSAFFNASSVLPVLPSAFVFRQKSHFHGLSCFSASTSFLLEWRIPLLSTIMMFPGLTPALMRTMAVRVFADPTPIMVIFAWFIFLPTILSAFIIPASITVAVPCWSSCQTGMFSFFLVSSSMWKHLGLLMSSRFIPPNVGSNHLHAVMISSGFLVPRQIGNASTPPRYLNRSAFPSMTGSPACGPMSPSPSTRVPSLTTATKFHLFVCVKTCSGSSLIFRHEAATPGVYQIAKSAGVRIAHFGMICIFP